MPFDGGENEDEALGLLTTQAAALWLGVSTSQLEKWRCLGGGPKFIQVGRLIRYSRAHMRNYIAERTKRSTSDIGPAKTTDRRTPKPVKRGPGRPIKAPGEEDA